MTALPSFIDGVELTAAQLNAIVTAMNNVPLAGIVMNTGATMTGPLLAAPGSVIAPGLAFAGFVGTGLSLLGAGTSVLLGVNGAAALEVNGADVGGYYAKIANGTTIFGPTLSAESGVAVAGFNYTTKGAAAHRFFTNAMTDQQFQIANTTGAVNYYRASGGVTGSAAKITAFGTDTNVDAEIVTQALGKFRVTANGGTALQVEAQGAGGYYLRLLNNTGTGGPILISEGSTANVSASLISKGTGSLFFCTAGSTSNVQMEVLHNASAVNKIQIGGAASGFRAGFRQRGETNIGMSFDINGTGDYLFTGGAFSNTAFQVVTVTSSVNAPRVTPSLTGLPVVFGVSTNASDTNVGVALPPKGTGALSAAVPDSAATGGNARGASAVDWQTARTTAAQVASAQSSTVSGGSGNTASGTYSTAAGGQANTASASLATVGGGIGNAAGGVSSWIPGGDRATTRSTIGRGAWASGQFATPGDAQASELVLRCATTDATQTALAADGAAATASNQFIAPLNSVSLVQLLVTARQPSTGDSATWIVTAAIKRAGTIGSTALLGGGGASIAPTYNDSGAAAWRLAVSADSVTRAALNILVTGEAAKSLQWVARVMSVENIG